jgi:hypothetical protein
MYSIHGSKVAHLFICLFPLSLTEGTSQKSAISPLVLVSKIITLNNNNSNKNNSQKSEETDPSNNFDRFEILRNYNY